MQLFLSYYYPLIHNNIYLDDKISAYASSLLNCLDRINVKYLRLGLGFRVRDRFRVRVRVKNRVRIRVRILCKISTWYHPIFYLRFRFKIKVRFRVRVKNRVMVGIVFRVRVLFYLSKQWRVMGRNLSYPDIPLHCIIQCIHELTSP